MVKDCNSISPSAKTEKEAVSLILKRQRVAKLVNSELSLRQMLDLGDTDDYILSQQTIISDFRKSPFSLSPSVSLSLSLPTCL
jgi:hypothetical protein